jgi:hypothetical protein
MTAPFFGAKLEDVKEKLLIMPPQCHLLDFDGHGKVAQFVFYTVDRNYRNTGGLGGAFGLLYGVGRAFPFPECQPYKPQAIEAVSLFHGIVALYGEIQKGRRIKLCLCSSSAVDDSYYHTCGQESGVVYRIASKIGSLEHQKGLVCRMRSNINQKQQDSSLNGFDNNLSKNVSQEMTRKRD